MKDKIFKTTVLLLIISILFFLSNAFILLISGFAREHNAIDINNNNRETVISLFEENIDYHEQVPDINKVTKIEHLVLLHDDKITVYYQDGTTYDFLINYGYKNPFTLYIKNEGYSVYFNSSEFVIHLIKVIVPFILSVVFVVVLLKRKKKN